MNDAILIFIVPPDLAMLESRLRGRQTDSEQILKRLMARVKWQRLSLMIIGLTMTLSERELLSILIAERNRRLSNPTLLRVGSVQR